MRCRAYGVGYIIYNLNHPDKDIIIYKDELFSAFRRILYHPDVSEAYTFVLSTHLGIPVGMVFGSRNASSLFCILSNLR